MISPVQRPDGRVASRRLAKADRRRQLLDTALLIVREEGADRLTLGHLATRAGVSKPVAYDHFATRSGLLIALYRWIDEKRINAFQDSMIANKRNLLETAEVLAEAYIDCAVNTTDGFQAVGAALAGSEEKAAVFQELLDDCVEMFVSVLKPHTTLSSPELQRCCISLVGAGEALAGAVLLGKCSKAETTKTFAWLIQCGLRPSST